MEKVTGSQSGVRGSTPGKRNKNVCDRLGELKEVEHKCGHTRARPSEPGPIFGLYFGGSGSPLKGLSTMRLTELLNCLA